MDMYLRILKAIDEEVVDRDVIRSQQVNFVNCFKNCNATISIGENISPTERVTIKQKFTTYSIRTIYSGILLYRHLRYMDSFVCPDKKLIYFL